MRKAFKVFNSGRAIFFMMVILCCIIGGAVLKLAATVILPFVIAVLLAFAMFPLVMWLDKYKIPRFISILLVVLIIISVLFLFGVVLINSGMSVVSLFPRYEERMTEIYIFIAQLMELPYDESLSFWENLWGQSGIRTWVRNFSFSFSNIFINFLSNAFLVVIFVVFILLEASQFKDKLEAAFEDRADRVNQMGRDLVTQVTRYLTAKFFISLATGILIGVGLWIIGVEFAVTWGVISFVLNFIPNLGSIAAGVATSVFALLQFWPDPVPVILTVVLILVVNMVIGNFLDPRIVGNHVGLSPLVVLISLVFWGYIWGFAGMVLSVPMMVIIKIICENVPILEPVSIILGSRKYVSEKILERSASAETPVDNNLDKTES